MADLVQDDVVGIAFGGVGVVDDDVVVIAGDPQPFAATTRSASISEGTWRSEIERPRWAATAAR